MRRAIYRQLSTTHASTLMVTLTVLATYASAVLTSAEVRTWPGAAGLATQLLLPAALGSCVFLCIACRLYPRDSVAWLAAALTMVGVQTFPMLTVGDTRASLAQVPLLSPLVVGAVLVVFVHAARSYRLRVSPVPIGVAIGVALILVRAVSSHFTIPRPHPRSLPLPPAPYLNVAGFVLLVAIGIVLMVAINRTSALPLGARRLSAAVFLWTLTSAVRAAGWLEVPAWSLIVVTAGLATCVLVASAAVDLLLRSIQDDQQAALKLQHQLLALRNRNREGLEQMHEVKGTIAGIASATDLMRSRDKISGQVREHLEEMLATEAQRLQRLVHPEGWYGAPELVELDELVRPLVLSRQIQGQDVRWDPPTEPLWIEGGALAEAVNILLHNAAEHAGGAPVRVFTRERAGTVELVVADRGPGVPEELRDYIFDWGRSRPGSPGQGIGLAMARRILAGQGRSLILEPGRDHGATFVIGLTACAVGERRGEPSVLAG